MKYAKQLLLTYMLYFNSGLFVHFYKFFPLKFVLKNEKGSIRIDGYFSKSYWKPLESVTYFVSYFIKHTDEGANFSGALYYGREWLHISFEILFINFVDYFTENFILSITILFIVQKVICCFVFVYLKKIY